MILQLGTLSESVLTSSDIYLCIKPTENYANKKRYVEFCAVWRSYKTQKVVYQTLDSSKDALTPISLEMLTEDLPQLLQSLLISVEQTISRVPLDELTFPKYVDEDDADNDNANISSSGRKLDSRSTPGNGSPKCGIKRREIITKNKPPQNRHTLRRLSTINSNTVICEKRDIDVSTLPPATDVTPMPLFCLGGSFPHIDSDEDSADDGTKSPNDRTFFCLHFFKQS